MQQNLFEAAKTAKSPDALLLLARENGVKLTEEQAQSAFARLHGSGELSDDELDNVSGGGCSGKKSVSSAEMACPVCGNMCRDGYCESDYAGFTTVIFQCGCGKSFRGVYFDGGSYAEDL